MTRTVAMTGATGFIGWHVARQFQQSGWHVRGLVRPDSDRPLPAGVERLAAALDEGAVRSASEGADVIVHMAALIRARSAAEFTRVNVDGTRAVARAARALGIRLVHTSSLGVTGPADPGHPPGEDAAPRPINLYGESKRESERVVRETEGLDWTIVRPTLVYGPRDRLFLPIFRMARHGFFPVPQPSAVYNVVHVEDAARAFERAATAPDASGEVFFVGHPEHTRALDMLQLAASSVGRAFHPFVVPRTALRLAAEVGTVLSRLGLPVALDRARFAELDAAGFVCRVDKARARLGFEAAIGLREGFQMTADWYRDAGWLGPFNRPRPE